MYGFSVDVTCEHAPRNSRCHTWPIAPGSFRDFKLLNTSIARNWISSPVLANKLSSNIITIHPGLSSGDFAASQLPGHPVEVGVRSRAPVIHLEILCLTICMFLNFHHFMSDRDFDRKEAEFTLTVNECEHLRRSTCKSSTRRPKQFLLEISTQWRLVWKSSRLKFGKISSRLLLQIYSQCGSASIHCIADPSSVSSPDSTKCRHPSTAFHHPIWANISIDVSGSGTAVLYYSHVMPSGWLHMLYTDTYAT